MSDGQRQQVAIGEGDWNGTVDGAKRLGSNTIFHIQNSGLGKVLTVRVTRNVNFSHGDKITLNPRKNEICRFDAAVLRVN